MLKHWKWTSLLCTALIAITLASSGSIEGKGKPPKDDGGGDGGTTELPDVLYQTEFFVAPADGIGIFGVYGANNVGQVVGSYNIELPDGQTTQRAFLYDPLLDYDSVLGIGQAIDLNNFDYDVDYDIPPGPAHIKSVVW